MFTGLVEETGVVREIRPGERRTLTVSAERVLEGVEVGDSISVNGACLTVDEVGDGGLSFYAMPETLRRTSLGGLREGAKVNLERAMSAQGRFGGHLVQGHVDAVGEVLGIVPEGEAEMWEFAAPADALRYVVEKGSICIEGISLTVVSVLEDSFTASILPQTRGVTNLGTLRVGARVNLEVDVIGKYVERMAGPWMERAMSASSSGAEGER